MKSKNKKLLSVIIVMCVILTSIAPTRVHAAVKLSATRKTLSVGQSFALNVTGTYEKAEWSSSKKSVASVDQSGKITAKKAGNAIITAKVSGKTLKCKVRVKKSNIKSRTVYKDENVVVKLLGISEPGSLGGYNIELQVENLTENSLTVQNRETSINGYMAETSALSVDVSPGKKVKTSLMVFGDDSEEFPVIKIKSVETKLMICNADDYSGRYETEIFTII